MQGQKTKLISNEMSKFFVCVLPLPFPIVITKIARHHPLNYHSNDPITIHCMGGVHQCPAHQLMTTTLEVSDVGLFHFILSKAGNLTSFREVTSYPRMVLKT